MQPISGRLFVMAGFGAWAVSLALAQPQRSEPTSTASRAPAATTAQSNETPGTNPHELVTFNFPGGTVTEFIEMLRKAMGPTALNVLVDKEAAKQQVPAVKLTNASYFYVLRLLDRSEFDEQGRLVQMSVEQVDTREGQMPIFKVRAMAQGGENTTGFSVLSLNPIIGLPGSARATVSQLDSKSVLAAVEAAVVASGDQSTSPPTLKFHEPSGLLFVRGTPTQRAAASEVVQQLRRDVDAERAAEQAATAGRSTQKILLKAEVPDELVQKLRKKFEGSCCVQFETDGKYLIITGDRELVSAAGQLAFINDQAAIQRKEKEAAKK